MCLHDAVYVSRLLGQFSPSIIAVSTILICDVLKEDHNA